jgi:formylglycine-generating enzyme required for sulfatase activity
MIPTFGFTRLVPMMLLLLPLLAGCGGDDAPDAPVTTGAITINVLPADIDASWALTGPQETTGSGSTTLNGQPLGDYSLTFGAVAGWTTPPNATGTLAAGAPLTLSGTYVADIGYDAEFVLIPAGTFTMGSPAGELGRWTDETQHEVTLTHGLYISKYEVTEQWWDEVMGTAASLSHSPRNPVSWNDAVLFCNALSVVEGLTPAYTINAGDGNVTWNQAADGYRLPTEAEWEYACRAGSATGFANGEITSEYATPLDPMLDAIGWYYGNTGAVREVGLKAVNAWGLYDMHGNLWEWCWDRWDGSDYATAPVSDPVGQESGDFRALRGGYWGFNPPQCRSAARYKFNPAGQKDSAGLRPVRTAGN